MNLDPDISTFGKAMANGFSFFIAGKKDNGIRLN